MVFLTFKCSVRFLSFDFEFFISEIHKVNIELVELRVLENGQIFIIEHLSFEFTQVLNRILIPYLVFF